MDSFQTYGQYHSVFAQTVSEIVTRMAKDEKDIAKNIIRFNITYAYTLYKIDKDINNQIPVETIKQELDNMNLDSKDIFELIIIMVKYQSLAGIKPTQQFTTNSVVYDAMKEKLQRQAEKNIGKQV